MSFDADEFDFEEEFEKHDLNKGIPSYLSNAYSGRPGRSPAASSSSPGGSSSSSAVHNTGSVIVAVAVPVPAESRPVSVRSQSVDADILDGPEILTPMLVATVDSESPPPPVYDEEPLPESFNDTPLPPPVPMPPASSDEGLENSGPMIYPPTGDSNNSRNSWGFRRGSKGSSPSGGASASSSVQRPPRPKWSQEFACISSTPAYNAINAPVRARHDVLMRNERTFLETRFAGAPGPSPSTVLARLRDSEECSKYHDDCFAAELKGALALMRRYLAKYRELHRSELYGEINRDQESQYRAVVSEAVGDYLRVRTEEIARLAANSLAPFAWDRVDRGVERDCLTLLLPSDLNGTSVGSSAAGGVPEPLLQELGLDSPEAALGKMKQCRMLVAGYLEVVCTLPYSWCSAQGKLLYDYGGTAVLLGRHPWRRSHTILLLFLEYLLNEVLMEHCQYTLFEAALKHVIELSARVWVQW